jgi:hypothetical protein
MKNIFMMVSIIFMVVIVYAYKTNIEPIFIRINTLCEAIDELFEELDSSISSTATGLLEKDENKYFLFNTLGYFLGSTNFDNDEEYFLNEISDKITKNRKINWKEKNFSGIPTKKKYVVVYRQISLMII